DWSSDVCSSDLPFQGLVFLSEQQHRETFAYDGHGAVSDFGRAEGFSVKATGFFQFQGCFLGCAKTYTAPDDKQVACLFKTIDDRLPVIFPRLCEGLRQGLEGALQFFITTPLGDEMHEGTQSSEVK